MIVLLTAFGRNTDPLVDAPRLFSREYDFAVLPRIGEWIESVDFEDEDDIYVVKAILHYAREHPLKANAVAPSMDSIAHRVEVILEPR